MQLWCTQTMLRFPRRYPLVLLVILIPFSLLLYTYFGQLSTWGFDNGRPVPIISPGSPIGSANNTLEPEMTEVSGDSEIILVSAFYPLSKSKHSSNDYAQWLSRFLAKVKTPIYFYCPPDLKPMIRSLRGNAGPITIDTRYATTFDIPPLDNRELAYKKMHRYDREKLIHSPELYSVWTAKAFFLAEALRQLGISQNSDKPNSEVKYAFWTDAGSFRENHAYSSWPSLPHIEETFSSLSSKVKIFFPISRLPNPSISLWSPSLGPVDVSFSEGSFFGGSPSSVFWFEKTYYSYHDYWLSQHVFVGKDQTLFNALFLMYPDNFVTVFHSDPSAPMRTFTPSTLDPAAISQDEARKLLGDCGDTWFYYQFFLATSLDREMMNEMWAKQWNWDILKIWRVEWWRGRSECRLTRPLSMKGALRSVFGKSWEPPMNLNIA